MKTKSPEKGTKEQEQEKAHRPKRATVLPRARFGGIIYIEYISGYDLSPIFSIYVAPAAFVTAPIIKPNVAYLIPTFPLGYWYMSIVWRKNNTKNALLNRRLYIWSR